MIPTMYLLTYGRRGARIGDRPAESLSNVDTTDIAGCLQTRPET
jgi:hypothetical protein